MAGPIVDISVRIEVLNPQRQSTGGTVDIELQPQAPGQTVNVKAADASKDIDCRRLSLKRKVGLLDAVVRDL